MDVNTDDDAIESISDNTNDSSSRGARDRRIQSRRVAGRIRIELTGDEIADVRTIGYERNDSYKNGRTRDTNYTSSSGQSLHDRGVAAEYALSLLYDEATMDRGVYDDGDDGVDTHLEIDGETYTVDVKASSYENAWLLVRADSPTTGASDVYVSSYVDVDEGVVEIVGFAWENELVREENLEASPAKYSDHLNYEQKRGFEPMPIPDLDDERVQFSSVEILSR